MSQTRQALLLSALLLCPFLPSCAEHSGTNPTRVSKTPGGPGDDGGIFKPRPTNPVGTAPDEGGNRGGGTPIGGGGNGGGTGPGGGGPVPEPTTMLLVGGGLAGAAWLRKRAAAKKA